MAPQDSFFDEEDDTWYADAVALADLPNQVLGQVANPIVYHLRPRSDRLGLESLVQRIEGLRVLGSHYRRISKSLEKESTWQKD